MALYKLSETTEILADSIDEPLAQPKDLENNLDSLAIANEDPRKFVNLFSCVTSHPPPPSKPLSLVMNDSSQQLLIID